MSSKRGFTLVELLIVIAILAVLASIGFASFRGAQSQARDGQRKQDLRQLAAALEIYYQKNDAYINPAGTGANDCSNSAKIANFYTAIAPFMANQKVPVDPLTDARYCYLSVNNGVSFRLFAKLENSNDKDAILCTNYNYTVFSQDLPASCAPGDSPLPTPTLGPTTAPTAGPTSTPSPTPTTCTPGTQTFVVAASEDDGYISAQGSTYPGTVDTVITTGSSTVTNKGYNGSIYLTAVGLYRWYTSSIPDNANITDATFRGYVRAKDDVDNRSLTADWYTDWPIGEADWTATAQTSALAGVDITSINLNATNDFSLQNVATNVSKTGYTGLRFHTSGGVPTGYNRINFATSESTDPKPTLLVTYTCP